MGMHWVVIALHLAIQPDVNQFELVAPWHPWATPLRWLFVNHVADPALASFEKYLLAKFPNGGLCWIEFSLLVELASEAH